MLLDELQRDPGGLGGGLRTLGWTIERDLRQMLDEPDEQLPPGETAIEGMLY